MNSRGKPVFVYSYDPPSPDVPSEYDPPHPLEMSTPSSSTSIDFTTLDNYCNTKYDSGHHQSFSAFQPENSTLELRDSVNFTSLFDPQKQETEQTQKLGQNSAVLSEIENDTEVNSEKTFSFSQNQFSTQKGRFDENIDEQNSYLSQPFIASNPDDPLKFVFLEGRNPFEIFHHNEETVLETSANTRSSLKNNDSQIVENKFNQNVELNDGGFNEGNSESQDCSTKFTSTDSIEFTNPNLIYRRNFQNENNVDSVTGDRSITIYPTDLTVDDARCLSPESTVHSISSLPSDTVTINVPFESSLSGNENQTTDWEGDELFNFPHELMHQHEFSNNHSQYFCDDEYDSGNPTLSPAFSPFLTESCTITPFPTSNISPNSTNPTSTPLPSPIPSEVISTITSESSPSTPSTVTSSTLFCLSRKLESLTNTPRENDLASNKYQQLHDVAKQSSENTNVIHNSSQPQQNCSISDDFNKYLNSEVSEESFTKSQLSNLDPELRPKNNDFFEEGNLNILDEVSNHKISENMYSKRINSLSKIFDKDKKEEYDREKPSAIIYRYSPHMEKSNVNELKQVFYDDHLSVGVKKPPPCHKPKGNLTDKPKQENNLKNQKHEMKSQLKNDEVTKPFANLADKPKQENHLKNKKPDELKAQAKIDKVTKPFAKDTSSPIQNVISPKSTSKTFPAPPPPPPRSDSSQKIIPPPLPPPPKDEEEFEETPPPIPSLPSHLAENKENNHFFPVPPPPPVRQYLLIPLTPGKASPLLLTPHEISSAELSPIQKSSPPPPPPPRQSTPGREVDSNLAISPSSFSSFHDASSVSARPTRRVSLPRELTPVPEERTSSNSKSPSPYACDEESHDQTEQIVAENKSNSTENRNLEEDPPKIPALPSNQDLHSSPSPPPLPPKVNPLNISPLKRLPFPPPPPPPPKRCGSLPRTRTPSPGSGRLSPCRVRDRSPPNDRIFTISPAGESPSGRHMEKSGTASNDDLPPPPIPPPTMPCSQGASPCMTVSPYGKLVVDRADIPLPSPEEEIRKVYNNSKMWGWLTEGEGTLALYTQFRPIIQQGPQCGLVALSMASQACPSTVPTCDLLRKAQANGISRRGEMFSVESMSALSNEVLQGVRASVKRDILSSPAEIVKLILEGDFILFPYDSEPNHFPGQRKGWKAHWGLLCGCLVQTRSFVFKPDSLFVKPDLTTDNLWHARPATRTQHQSKSASVPPSRLNDLETETRNARSVSPSTSVTSVEGKIRRKGSLFSEIGPEDWCERISNLVVIFRQGKSRNLIYAPLKDLYESNKQLVEYPTPEDYVIGSVEDGLARQVVVLHKEKQGLSDLLGILRDELKD